MCKKSTSLCQVPRARAAPADYGNNNEQISVTGATGNLPTAEPFQLRRNLYQPPYLEASRFIHPSQVCSWCWRICFLGAEYHFSDHQSTYLSAISICSLYYNFVSSKTSQLLMAQFSCQTHALMSHCFILPKWIALLSRRRPDISPV